MIYKTAVIVEAKHVKVFKTEVSKKNYGILLKLQKYRAAKLSRHDPIHVRKWWIPKQNHSRSPIIPYDTKNLLRHNKDARNHWIITNSILVGEFNLLFKKQLITSNTMFK